MRGCLSHCYYISCRCRCDVRRQALAALLGQAFHTQPRVSVVSIGSCAIGHSQDVQTHFYRTVSKDIYSRTIHLDTHVQLIFELGQGLCAHDYTLHANKSVGCWKCVLQMQCLNKGIFFNFLAFSGGHSGYIDACKVCPAPCELCHGLPVLSWSHTCKCLHVMWMAYNFLFCIFWQPTSVPIWQALHRQLDTYRDCTVYGRLLSKWLQYLPISDYLSSWKRLVEIKRWRESRRGGGGGTKTGTRALCGHTPSWVFQELDHWHCTFCTL